MRSQGMSLRNQKILRLHQKAVVSREMNLMSEIDLENKISLEGGG
jgi:hypothetical protein